MTTLDLFPAYDTNNQADIMSKALPVKREEIIGNCRLLLGDSREILPLLSGIDDCVTDPPYHLISNTRNGSSRQPGTGPYGRHRLSTKGFMGKEWDGGDIAFQPEIWNSISRTMKPGAHLLAFSGSRTYHRMACAIEDAGLEIRDQIMWVYGSGFPKSHNLEGQWEGWGTALKPAHEPLCMARKPLIGTVAENVTKHGVGALNIDGCRLPTQENLKGGSGGLLSHLRDQKHYPLENTYTPSEEGRWPANFIHDGSEEVLATFPNAKGQQGMVTGQEPSSKTNNVYGQFNGRPATNPRLEADTSAARFFYCAKAGKADRDEGLDDLPLRNAGVKNDSGRGYSESDPYREIRRRNHHPTVKPTDLMRYLCRLITPPAGIVLDPFMGSGSTGKAAVLEGFSFIGIEREEEYFDIACRRVDHAYKQRELIQEQIVQEKRQVAFSFDGEPPV
jgi:site-specific DNA-methyltransferase (adenine-specific)